MCHLPVRCSRAAPWAFLWVLPGLATACTSMLGIDGTYVTDDGLGAHAPPQPTPDAGAPSRDASAGPPPDAKPVDPGPPDAGAPRTCREGHYEGKFSGASSLSFGTPLDGTIKFDLVPSTAVGRDFDVQNGTMKGSFLGATSLIASFDATFTGAVDCAAGSLAGALTGSSALLNLGPLTTKIPFTGTLSARYDYAAVAFVAGHWAEQHSGGRGNGDFDAARTGP
jgi:hypothetical protein